MKDDCKYCGKWDDYHGRCMGMNCPIRDQIEKEEALAQQKENTAELRECQLCGSPAAELIKIKNRNNGNELDICLSCCKKFGLLPDML